MPTLYLLILFIAHACEPQQPPTIKVDLLKIAGKTRAEMVQHFGPVTKEEVSMMEGTACQCTWIYFLEDKLAILFIDGKADWIVAYQPLEIINLDKTKVMSYTNFRVKVFLRLLHMKNDACCAVLKM